MQSEDREREVKKGGGDVCLAGLDSEIHGATGVLKQGDQWI